MDKLLQILRLCLPRLEPRDICILKCTCSELRDMRVSWHDHSINFQLDGSASATSWLHRNIVSMQTLNLKISLDLPQRTLQDVMEGGRNLTILHIKSDHIKQLPPLPPQLEQLHVTFCSELRELPELPPTLRHLDCWSCHGGTS